jgi:protein arginine kinase
MRNLAGFRFPNRAATDELMTVMKRIVGVAEDSHLGFEAVKGLAKAERDHLVGCRLVSPDFQWNEPARMLLMDQARSISIMVNEEDHLRAQALTAGWSIDAAESAAGATSKLFEDKLPMAQHPRFGYLSASPFNCGDGRRLSCMMHLIGLANSRRLPEVLKALNVRGLTARGLFGESSRAVGAFLQVSVIGRPRAEFVGAVDYLIREERTTRNEALDALLEKAQQAREFIERSRTLSPAEALRLLGWVRWASGRQLPWAPRQMREVDQFLTMVDIRPDESGKTRAAERADALRRMLPP